MRWGKCDGNFKVARYFAFYTYQKMTSCWKRRGPQVRGTGFSGLASLHFTSDYDPRNGYATNIFRKANICTTHITKDLVS